MSLPTKNVQAGFSVVELMISLGIIMLILSFVAPGLLKLLTKGNQAATKNTLNIVKQAILEYKSDVHVVPDKLADLDKKPEGINGWNGSYLPESMQGKEIVDAWNQPLVYKKSQKGSAKPYELYSEGDPEKEEDKIYA